MCPSSGGQLYEYNIWCNHCVLVAVRYAGQEESEYSKTKYVVMSRDQNAEQCHSVETDNSSFEMVKVFKYLGTNLTNQNSI
jgi:hypothetical protein